MNKKIQSRHQKLIEVLLHEMNPDGYWTGELSSSALGVAVAITALHFHNSKTNKGEIEAGINWLIKNINSDGGYGDTKDSPSNISTSLLVYSALNLYLQKENVSLTHKKLAHYLMKQKISVDSDQMASSVISHYKTDYTFSVPILSMSALCGLGGSEVFKKIPSLPFEWVLLPQKFYRFFKLNVVSYAVPALIAVGILIHKKKKKKSLWSRLREQTINKALNKLEQSLPESGGFLEAIPLTAFVSLSLINAGYKDSKTVKKGIQFLKEAQKADGSWPIDIDLSTWVTTLSIKSLRSYLPNILNSQRVSKLQDHLIKIQNKTTHPFNGTSKGGWGWTNYSGSVPDGDDTPGAILALLQLSDSPDIKNSTELGIQWLLRLQNRDGGFPTFSKGWGKLPFDKSSTDLTGHCILAITSFIRKYPDLKTKKHIASIQKAVRFLNKNQNSNGSWIPLWFGNQHTTDHSNPIYGTARISSYLNDSLAEDSLTQNLRHQIQSLLDPALNYIETQQNSDGSWGAELGIQGSIEETSLALSAIMNTSSEDLINKGIDWLHANTEASNLKATPIGLYFASLWYDEKLYPLTAYIECLSRYMESKISE